MEKTWRWFGKSDPITLTMLRQIGVEGIVTALHQIPNGEVWPYEAIMDLKSYIESYGLRWSVVESLPVCEAIKYGGADRERLLSNYRESLANLGRAGIHTICYNFMPVLDWARTDLAHPWADGATSLYFRRAEFTYFDRYILRRLGCENDYSEAELAEAEAIAQSFADDQQRAAYDHRLVDAIIVKTQGFVNGNITEHDERPVELFRQLLSLYDGIDRDTLRANLCYFLQSVMPVCDEWDMNLCIHPDDPPMQLLGLPRIVTCDDDIRWLLDAVPNHHNGLTFCCGSLSAGLHNDIPAMARRYAERTHFVHLRSTDVQPNGDFIEANHLAGRAHLIEVVRIFERMNPTVPMRVDHGRTILGDETRGYNAGYSFHGRMMALAQMDGVMATVRDELENQK